jgi:sensor histidine kinase YesM
LRDFELKISAYDWIYIILFGSIFGTFISSFMYLLNDDLKNSSTIFFGTISAINISIFAAIFISISNNYILPKLKIRLWQIVSFCFSFLAGSSGFLFNYYMFYDTHAPIILLVESHLFTLTVLVGLMTFLVGFILHLFVSMKYKTESIEKKILETKIKALENELNPHFLFNALNSVSELIYQDQNRAETTVLKLSKFLRNAINKTSLITLKEELEMTKNYVDIENIRFGEKIKLEIQTELLSLESLVPKFSIQLLVENAIKHGFEQKDLHVLIYSKNRQIIVCNDGIIPHKITYATGLTNLRKRLKYLKVGTLSHSIEKDKLSFCIELL